MNKNILVVALIAVLALGVFALTGCEKKESANTNTNATNTQAENTSTAEVQATEFYIQNAFPNDTTIKEIYATVSNLETWTPNLIEGLELAPSTRAKIGLGLTATTSSWDFKVVDSEGTAVVFSSVDLTKIMNNEAGAVELTVDENGQLAANVK